MSQEKSLTSKSPGIDKTGETPKFLWVQELITLHSDGKKVVTPAGSNKDLSKLKSVSEATVRNILPFVDRDVVAVYTSETLGAERIVEGKVVLTPLSPEKYVDKVYWINAKYVDAMDVPSDYPNKAEMYGELQRNKGRKFLKSRDGQYHCVVQESNIIIDIPTGVQAV